MMKLIATTADGKEVSIGMTLWEVDIYYGKEPREIHVIKLYANFPFSENSRVYVTACTNDGLNRIIRNMQVCYSTREAAMEGR